MGNILEISSYDVNKDPSILRGLPSKLIDMPEVVVPQGLDDKGPYSDIIVPEHFPPGSIMVFETRLQELDADLDTFCVSGAQEAFGDLSLVDLNVVLYRADNEERDVTDGEFGVYNIPGLGAMVYCGLEGWIHPLRHVMRYNDLGHPLCAHLREGTWSMDYIHSRLIRHVNLESLLGPQTNHFFSQASGNTAQPFEACRMVQQTHRAYQSQRSTIFATKIFRHCRLGSIQGVPSCCF